MVGDRYLPGAEPQARSSSVDKVDNLKMRAFFRDPKLTDEEICKNSVAEATVKKVFYHILAEVAPSVAVKMANSAPSGIRLYEKEGDGSSRLVRKPGNQIDRSAKQFHTRASLSFPGPPPASGLVATAPVAPAPPDSPQLPLQQSVGGSSSSTSSQAIAAQQLRVSASTQKHSAPAPLQNIGAASSSKSYAAANDYKRSKRGLAARNGAASSSEEDGDEADDELVADEYDDEVGALPSAKQVSHQSSAEQASAKRSSRRISLYLPTHVQDNTGEKKVFWSTQEHEELLQLDRGAGQKDTIVVFAPRADTGDLTTPMQAAQQVHEDKRFTNTIVWPDRCLLHQVNISQTETVEELFRLLGLSRGKWQKRIYLQGLTLKNNQYKYLNELDELLQRVSQRGVPTSAGGKPSASAARFAETVAPATEEYRIRKKSAQGVGAAPRPLKKKKKKTGAYFSYVFRRCISCRFLVFRSLFITGEPNSFH